MRRKAQITIKSTGYVEALGQGTLKFWQGRHRLLPSHLPRRPCRNHPPLMAMEVGAPLAITDRKASAALLAELQSYRPSCLGQ